MTANPLPAGRCVPRWLEALSSAVPELTEADWAALAEFETQLRTLLSHPSQQRTHRSCRGEALLAIRRELVGGTLLEHDHCTAVRRDLRQTVRQVICGFYDLDHRDATGPGHARMILRHGTPSCRARWEPRLRSGELGGIAMTEAAGGTQIQAITTVLLPAVGGGWRLTGEKCWISRLSEASVFVVFARGPGGRIAAAAVDGATQGITRHPDRPTGLAGWSWGRIEFDAVPVPEDAVLTGPALDGLAIFDGHFAYYRPLVTATALGGAAAVHDTVATHLADREQRGEIGRVRDHALIAVGRAQAQIAGGMLAALHTQRLTASGHPDASLWARTTKALGVDLARDAVDQLAVLVGAVGFTADHHLQKTRLDLDALRYADGMHDSLNRSAGRALLTTAPRHRGGTSHRTDQEGATAHDRSAGYDTLSG